MSLFFSPFLLLPSIAWNILISFFSSPFYSSFAKISPEVAYCTRTCTYIVDIFFLNLLSPLDNLGEDQIIYRLGCLQLTAQWTQCHFQLLSPFLIFFVYILAFCLSVSVSLPLSLSLSLSLCVCLCLSLSLSLFLSLSISMSYMYMFSSSFTDVFNSCPLSSVLSFSVFPWFLYDVLLYCIVLKGTRMVKCDVIKYIVVKFLNYSSFSERA